VSTDAALSAIEGQYGGWTDPLVAFRDALRQDPRGVEEDSGAWGEWLRDRGVGTEWLARIAVTDRVCGEITVVDGPYEDMLAVPRVYGTINDPHEGMPVRIPVEGGRYWTVADATVVGGWDIVTTPSGACWPALGPSTESVLVSNALGARLLGWTPSFMVVRDPTRGPRRRVASLLCRRRRRIDAAVALVGEHSFQYGHWMIDYLCRALAVRDVDASLPILVDAAISPSARWWLERVLPGRRILALQQHQPIEVGRLLVPLQRTFCPTGWIDSLELGPEVWSWDSKAIAELHRLATADRRDVRRHRRLFLPRRPGTNKPLVNQDELADAAARDGFQLVYPEDLSMPNLQALLDETEDVIAPVGSQVKNVVAARAGLRVLVLAGGDMGKLRGDAVHYGRVCGHEVALIGGRAAGPSPRTAYERKQAPYEVDVGLFEAARLDFFSGRQMADDRAAQ